jgi:hypothetical protein
MPCGTRARLTAYVVYQSLAFAEREVLLAALAAAGFTSIKPAPDGTDAANPLPVTDANGRIVASAAIVCRGNGQPAGSGDLGFVLLDGVYVPLVPGDGRADQLLLQLRGAYGRAKASQLAEQARHRYQAAVQRSTSADGTVTIRVRF